MRVGEGLRPAGGSCGEVSRSTCRWTLACTCALWALTLAFAPEKKLPPSSLLSATFHESLMTFAQVGQGRLGSSENKESSSLLAMPGRTSVLSEMSQAVGAQGGSATGKLVVAVGICTSVGFLWGFWEGYSFHSGSL